MSCTIRTAHFAITQGIEVTGFSDCIAVDNELAQVIIIIFNIDREST